MEQHQYNLQASIYAGALKRFVKLFDNRPFSRSVGFNESTIQVFVDFPAFCRLNGCCIRRPDIASRADYPAT